MILTEADWIAWCIRKGWKHSDIPALRALWRKYRPKFRNRFGSYVVSYKGIVIKGQRFSSRHEASKWADWNYKGRGGWEVLTFDQSQRRK